MSEELKCAGTFWIDHRHGYSRYKNNLLPQTMRLQKCANRHGQYYPVWHTNTNANKHLYTHTHTLSISISLKWLSTCTLVNGNENVLYCTVPHCRIKYKNRYVQFSIWHNKRCVCVLWMILKKHECVLYSCILCVCSHAYEHIYKNTTIAFWHFSSRAYALSLSKETFLN